MRTKDYTAAHELAGANEAARSLLQLADDLDEAQRDAEEAQEAGV